MTTRSGWPRSVRAAAFSAQRAGFAPQCADCFADADLARRFPTTRVDNYPDGLAAPAAEAPFGGWMYTGGLENCPDLVDQVVSINGVSKCYAMTGWRIGYAGGPREVIMAMKTMQSQITSNPSSISQAAAVAALDGDQTCITKMVSAYRERSDYIVKALNEIPGFECRVGEGAFYAFPQVTGAMQEKGLAEDSDLVKLLLNEADVVMVPGTPFGAPGYVRISFACSIDELEKAVARIKATLV